MTAGDRVGVAIEMLRARAHGSVRPGGAIAPLTSYRLGGPAGVLFEAEGIDDLRALSEAARASGADVLVVGRGSNMLVSDRGFDGIVLRLGGGFRWARADGARIHAGAAMPLPALSGLALQEQLTGLEFAVSIPASLGGAVRMNAGAHGSDMSRIVESADVFVLGDGREAGVGGEALGFSYRASSLSPDAIVTQAVLRLESGDPAAIAARMNEAREWRRAHQPLNLPNAGSVFKNPQGDHAARLVDEIVGKGARVGCARVSDVHANFIVAEDGATADEVYTLIRRIQRAVADAAGIELELELKLVGEFREVEA